MGGVAKIFANPKTFTGQASKEAKKKQKKAKSTRKRLADETKRADDLTNAFGRTLLNDPLGRSGSLLQGRPGGVGGGTLLGG